MEGILPGKGEWRPDGQARPELRADPGRRGRPRRPSHPTSRPPTSGAAHRPFPVLAPDPAPSARVQSPPAQPLPPPPPSPSPPSGHVPATSAAPQRPGPPHKPPGGLPDPLTLLQALLEGDRFQTHTPGQVTSRLKSLQWLLLLTEHSRNSGPGVRGPAPPALQHTHAARRGQALTGGFARRG